MRLITIATLCIVFLGMHLAAQAAQPAPGDISVAKVIAQLEKQATQLEAKQGMSAEVVDL